MSSSDSDDCYGNAALKFHNMKKKYDADKIDTTSILATKTEEVTAPTTNVVEILPNNEESEVDDEGAKVVERLLKEAEAKKSRVTRSRARKEIQTLLSEIDSNLHSNSLTGSSTSCNTRRARGSRGRGRGRRPPNVRTPRSVNASRHTNDHVTNLDDIPTYSIGNTYEYPDQSHGQELFKTVTNAVVIEDDNEITEEEEDLSVKVYWQNLDYFRFIMKKHQPLAEIFNFFANKENVKTDKLLFTYNDKIITPSDTPDSINYNFVKFIDGGIVNQSVDLTLSENIKNGIKIKFQCQNVKRPFETIISLDDKMSVAMSRCAEHLQVPLNSLVFVFDGDCISGKTTPRALELEGGECVDVRIFR